METWLQLALTSFASVIASSGFWAYMQSKDSKKDAKTRLMMGLAYDQLTKRGMEYINREWVTMEELEDYQKYFYDPYIELGGNGVAKRIMGAVSTLPLRSFSPYDDLLSNHQEEGFINNVRIVTRNEQ